MKKLRKWQSGDTTQYNFWCPGCKLYHGFNQTWKFNGNMDSPTVMPSLLSTCKDADVRCHLFIEDGNIRYLSDCHHELADQTIPMVDTETLYKYENDGEKLT